MSYYRNRVALGALPQLSVEGYIGGNDAYTVLLLHMDGDHSSTTFTDSSASGHTVTPAGAAHISTTYSVFGGASGYLSANGNHLSIADSADWNFGSGDFTIDFRVRFSSLVGQDGYVGIFSQYVGVSDRFFLSLYNQNTWRLLSNATTKDWATTVSADTWYHVALVRNGNNFMVFQDGVQCGTTTEWEVTLPDLGAAFLIGTYNGSIYTTKGWIDEFRISKGIARWTANFTPPSSPYS